MFRPANAGSDYDGRMFYAAMIRPVADRVSASVRVAARPLIADVQARTGLDPGFVISFYFGLLARPMSAAGFAAATTYSGADMTGELEQGIAVVDADGTWHLTDSGRALALAVQDATAHAAQGLWSRQISPILPPERLVTRLAQLLERLLIAGTASCGPAFAAMAPVFEPSGATPALLVSSRLGALRHYRGDAHRSAWQSAGLTLPELLALPRDSAQRQAIEDETNRLDDTIYQVLSEEERWELLALLGALP